MRPRLRCVGSTAQPIRADRRTGSVCAARKRCSFFLADDPQHTQIHPRDDLGGLGRVFRFKAADRRERAIRQRDGLGPQVGLVVEYLDVVRVAIAVTVHPGVSLSETPSTFTRKAKRSAASSITFPVGFPAPCPAFVSIRISTGASPACAACSAAANLNECAGKTRSSWSAVTINVGG